MKIYTANTLRYNFRQALAVCFCIGTSVLTMSIIGGKIVNFVKPVWYDEYGLTYVNIALLVSSIPNIISFFVVPIVSTLSDRTRTRWGRRIPYLAISAPIVALLAVAVAWTRELAGIISLILPQVSINTLQITVLAVLSLLFMVSYLFPSSIIYYLYADAIPKQWLSTFVAVMTVCGTVITFFFGKFILPYIFSHTKTIFVSAAVMYLLSFALLCLVVREGTYPPVSRQTRSNPFKNTINSVYFYFRQGFQHRIFILLFIATALNQTSTVCRGIYNTLFATKELHLSMQQLGDADAYGAVCSTLVVIPMGKLMDRIHPIRVYFCGGIVVIFMSIWGYFCVNSYASYLVIGTLTGVVYAVQFLGGMPMLIKLLPADKFGQLSSVNSLINSIFMIIGSFLGGITIQCLGYRFMFIWDALVTFIASITFWFVFQDWKKFGGINYVPPSID